MQRANIAYLNAINPTPVLSRYNKPKRKVKFNLISYADCFFFFINNSWKTESDSTIFTLL